MEWLLQKPTQSHPVLGDRCLGGMVRVAAEPGRRIGDQRTPKPEGGEPLVERVPQGLKARLRLRTRPVDPVPKPPQPLGAPLFELGSHQLVLAAEVPVEGVGSHLGPGDDAVDADLHTLLVEEVLGCIENPVVRSGGWSRHRAPPVSYACPQLMRAFSLLGQCSASMNSASLQNSELAHSSPYGD